MAGAPPPRVVVTAVDLHDLVPSARALTGCVRSVLFGIVEECARRATATDSSPVEDEDVDEEDAAAFLDARKRLLTDMVEHGFCAVDDADATLPTQFGKAKKKAKTKTKPTPRAQHNRKPLRREGRATAVPGVILRCPLPVPDDEATMAEHNIFLMPYPPDPPADGADGAVAGAAAMLYPVRVVGNAPFSTHTGCHGVVIEYLGYDDGPYCVPRQALRPVPAPPSASSSSPLAQAPAPADCSRFASTHRREIKGLLDQTLFPPAPAHLPDDVVKYWDQRYRFFTRLDHGVTLDEESWYSVTPEVIATHIADRCAAALLPPHAHPPLPPVPPVVVVWDLFCGCGGNALPLARHFPVVVAVDINPDKLPLVRHNAAVYGVWHRVEAVCGDAYDVLATLTSRRNQQQTCSSSTGTSLVDGSGGGGSDNEGDLAILAPPWGGPGYSASGAAFDLRTGFPSGDGFDLVAKTAAAFPHFVCVFPKNVATADVAALAMAAGGLPCVAERVSLYGKEKMLVLYFGRRFVAQAMV